MIEPLRAVPLFRNLPGGILEAVAARLRPERYEQGAVVFRRGDPADALYLVQAGQVDVLAGGTEEPVASLGPGGFFGEVGLVLGEPRSATLRAATDAELLVLDRADLDALLAKHPTVGLELSRELSRRLVATTQRIAPPAVSHFTAVSGGGAADLGRALSDLEVGRVGILTLPGASLPAAFPDELAQLHPDRLDAETLAGWAGRLIEGVDHLLLVLPPVPTAEAQAAIELAEHTVTFGPVAEWLPALAGRRLLRGDGPGPSVRRAARWVSGRAVGLAFSSGGSKGVAHVGVIRVLRELAIPIDAVAGSSGGAIAAVAVAFDLSEEEMLRLVRDMARHTTLRILRSFDVNLVPRAALFKGERLRQLFDTWFGGRTFAETNIPVWVVAADVDSGAEVVIGDGPVADGLRASMGVPVAFEPWPHEGRLLMDGSVVNPLPASVLRDAGIRFVIGSSVAGHKLDATGPPRGKPHMLQIVSSVIASAEAEMVRRGEALSDVLIRPRPRAANTFDFSRIEEFVAEGERAAREALAGRAGTLRP